MNKLIDEINKHRAVPLIDDYDTALEACKCLNSVVIEGPRIKNPNFLFAECTGKDMCNVEELVKIWLEKSDILTDPKFTKIGTAFCHVTADGVCWGSVLLGE